MRKSHTLLTVAVAMCWGVNAPIVKMTLIHLPLFQYCAIRSALLALLLLIVSKSPYPQKMNFLFATAHGIKISALYASLSFGLSVGLSTVVLQVQSLFAAVLAALILGEALLKRQLSGLIISFAGVLLIGHQTLSSIGNIAGLSLGLTAALFSASCLLLLRNYKKVTPMDSLAFVGWFNLYSILPFFLISFFVEGPDVWIDTTWLTSITVWILLILGSITVIGAYGLLSFVLSKNPTAEVSNFLLLTPVFGIGSAYICLNEICSAISILGALLVMVGLLISENRSLFRS